MSLLPEQKQFYSQNGYILVSNIFTETEISECSTAYDTLFADKVKNKSNLEAEWKGNWKNEHKKQSVYCYLLCSIL